MTATQTPTQLNGIDVDAFKDAIEAIRAEPAAGQTNWSVRTAWQGGCRTDTFVEGYGIGGQHVNRPFTIKIDEPIELTGSNKYANPQEHLLAAMNACIAVTYVLVASVEGVTLSKLEIETSGDIDLRGMLKLADDVAPGYQHGLTYRVTIAGDATDEQFAEIHEKVKQVSPNYFNVSQPVALADELVIARD